jgi:sphingomyelin phosphodiesterase acid-like 3
LKIRGVRLCLPAILFAASLLNVTAEAAKTAPATSSVVMLSDIHFDPFHDPAKFSQLQASPVEGWAAILDGPTAATQPAEFAALQATCGARGIDTPMALLRDSLRAARKAQPSPLFVTVSGDLMAHQFDCRFRNVGARFPSARVGPADLSEFAAKTVAFIALELRETFPGRPIYFALGNNDSGCHDYWEDPKSAFLRADAESFAADAIDPANRAAIREEFPRFGDYSVALPAPMRHARLIVLQDIFESVGYAACNGEPDAVAASVQGRAARDQRGVARDQGGADGEQTDWLRAQLTAARSAHEHVWVMVHIPPGINVYTTLSKANDVCGGGAPAMFLRGDALVDTLTAFPDVVRLALFAHTHMDEVRLLKSSTGEVVPAKLVPSISPVDGNDPAFTVAEVNPRTATLTDYTVYVDKHQPGAGNQIKGTSGRDYTAVWPPEYRYSTAYGLPDFSGTSLAKLTSEFAGDKNGGSAASRSYQSFYFAGQPSDENALKATLMMRLLWPVYVCSITQTDATGFRDCVCPASPPAGDGASPATKP